MRGSSYETQRREFRDEEGVVLSQESRSSEKFMHGIKVLMAKNYLDNLSEEATKGMKEKAAQGYWPTLAPLGYNNVRDEFGKKVIALDPLTAPLVRRLFEFAASGNYSLQELMEKAHELNLRYRRGHRLIGKRSILYVLRNRLYTGSYEWHGEILKGRHKPLITTEMWEIVQAMLDGRAKTNVRASPEDFYYTGIMRCGHCGCAIVAEIKKQRYIYYHCTGFKGKCPEPYVRQEVLDGHFEALLSRLSPEAGVHELLRTALKESHADERQERDETKRRLLAEADQLQDRLDIIYLDKIEGRISAEFYDWIVAPWRDQRAVVIRNLEHLVAVDESYIDDSVALIELVTSAHNGFASGRIVWVVGSSEAIIGARRSARGTGPDHRL